jgi:hypothetical protein
MKNELTLPWVEKVETLRKYVTEIVIVDAITCELAMKYSTDLAALRKDIINHHAPMIREAHQKHVEAKETEKLDLNPVIDLESKIDERIKLYRREQKRLQEEAQARADAEAKRLQDAEQKRLLAIAERAEKKGNVEKAEDFAERAASTFVPAPILPPTVAKTNRMESGTMSFIPETFIVVESPAAIIDAIVRGIEIQGHKFPISCVELKQGELKAWAKRNGIKAHVGNGVRIWQEEVNRKIGKR